MFSHNFKYTLKILFKNKTLLFWTLGFPIILGTFFYLAFADIEKKSTFEAVNIAIINNEEFSNNEILKNTYKSISSGDNKVLNIKYTDYDTAQELLIEDEIVAYLDYSSSSIIAVKKSGIKETIVKSVVEEINAKAITLGNVINKYNDYNNLDINYESIINDVYNAQSHIIDDSDANLGYTVIEYYTLIAMACIYGGLIGMYSLNMTLANMSKKGMRVSVNPNKKVSLVLSSVLASYIAQLIGLAALFIYTLFVLKVDYGSNIFLVILLALAGSLAGLAFGIIISAVLKKNENTKIGIMIALSMMWSFFAGMMGVVMKYIIDSNVKILNIINPVNMITDGFYALYYYDELSRYWFNFFSLIVFSLILITISVIILRRQTYDSI